MLSNNIDVPHDEISDFCRRWKITEFAVFGSALRDDFEPDSDIDVMVTFAPDAPGPCWITWICKINLESF